ncbi:peptide ABC transporter substrate-binding protein [Phytoactinopolyspora limicola]|uniref:peptide ABC transporter substrate-binding protein n=1 Tax=Phytoactinopolyspora limicola TaxID=2715536 RepID=UPI001409960E|nr:peptide ABC transporter substrate-binding protein [Phytoactinopolyspora limicola]
MTRATTVRGASEPIRRRTFLAATLAAAAAASAACGFGGSDDGGSADNNDDSGAGGSGDEPQRGGTLRQSMLPVTLLDPAVNANYSFGQIMMIGLWEGLVVADANDPIQVVPGVAESWDISGDGLIYTFHLRGEARWSNGDPVTANDFEWNWKRILTPGIAGESSPSYNRDRISVVGAADYMNGEIDDFSSVGAKAIDDATFELTLEKPDPDFLIYLSQFWALPLHPATVERLGDGWLDPENWVSNGAYVLDEFRVNLGAVLLPNDHYWDKDNYYIDRWEITFNDGGTTADLLSYQSGDLDITGRIEDDLEAVTTSDVADELMSSGTNQYRHLIALNSRHPALHDIKVRKALALAVDREALGGVGKPAIPGKSLVPGDVEGSDEVPGVEYDLEAAQNLLAEAGYPDGEGMPTITILDFQTSPWVEAIAEMWRKNLGLNVVLDIVELGVYSEKLNVPVHPEDYVGFMVTNNSVQPPTVVGAAYNNLQPIRTYGMNLSPPEAVDDILDELGADVDTAQIAAKLDGKRHPEVEQAVELAREALAQTDPEARTSLAIEAAIARDESYVSIPALWGGYFLLVKPRVQNLKPWFHTSVMSTKGVWIKQ